MRWMRIDEARRYVSGDGPLVSRKLLYSAIKRDQLRAARVGAGRNLVTCAEWLDEYLVASAQPRDARSGAVVAIDRPRKGAA